MREEAILDILILENSKQERRVSLLSQFQLKNHKKNMFKKEKEYIPVLSHKVWG